MALLKRAAGALLIVTAAIVCDRQMASAQSLEYEVKAAYLLNFTRFIEFPAAALGDAASPLRVCLAGSDPFGGALERTMAGERFETHPIAVETLTDPAAATRCHVLFVPRSAAGAAQPWIRAASGSVLTVGEQPGFLEAGGAIVFMIDAGHVRFDVNPSAASSHGIRISSKLLRVAHATLGPARSGT